MRKMARDRAIEFLQVGTRTGKLSTVRDDRRPHVTPVWFVVDDGGIVFNTWHTSVKARNLIREGRAAMVVDDDRPPFAYVMVEGGVTISEDLTEVVRVATLIGARYMGDNRAEEFGRRNGVAGELLIRMAFERIVAHENVAGYES